MLWGRQGGDLPTFVKKLREEDLVWLYELLDICALLSGGLDDEELEWD